MARQRASSEILLDQVPDGDQLLAVNPGLILDGPTPRLIDEWQRIPAVWDAVRRGVDDRRDPGQFILTGSATPAERPVPLGHGALPRRGTASHGPRRRRRLEPELCRRSQLVETPKRHLVDPSLAAALMRYSPQRLLEDLEAFGFLFESLATRDITVYAQNNDAEVYQYREAGGRFEVDLVAEDRDGNWIGIEVKLGGGQSIDAAAHSLLKLAEDRVAKPPQALLVVTGGQYCYRRTDDVYVVPLG